MTYRIFITRDIPQTSREEILAKFPDLRVEWNVWPHSRPPNKEELKKNVAESDALISLLSDSIDKEIIESAPHLKIISNYAVGYNNIDAEVAKEREIPVTNTPDVLTEATADLSLTLLLNVARCILPATTNALSGQWQNWEPQGFLGTDLREKTLGIVGMGRIGKEMARLCRETFNMRVLYTAARGDKNLSSAEFVGLNELLKTSDVVSLHCPLTEDNIYMLNKEKLAMMKSSAFLLNTARGKLIDTKALVESLESNHLAGVGLDVTDPEPLPPTHPLYQFGRVLITPHIGSATHRARGEMAKLCYENVLRKLAGKELLTPIF